MIYVLVCLLRTILYNVELKPWIGYTMRYHDDDTHRKGVRLYSYNV